MGNRKGTTGFMFAERNNEGLFEVSTAGAQVGLDDLSPSGITKVTFEVKKNGD